MYRIGHWYLVTTTAMALAILSGAPSHAAPLAANDAAGFPGVPGLFMEDGYPAYDAYPAEQPYAHHQAYPGQPVYRQPMDQQAYPNDDDVGDSSATVPERFQRQIVAYNTNEKPGTIIIDTPNTYLYLVLGHNLAMRYGIGVGREGFTWAGREKVSRMAEWPDWYPPTEMIERQPYLPRFMAGGESNPLGARALYIGNTLYRIHGTNQPSTIGTFVSSGCIRLTNADIEDLYTRVKVGTKIVVLPGKPPATASNTAAGAAPARTQAH